MLQFVFFYLANTAVLCYSLTILCCCQVQDYIYWIISTENDHRHHHKFIKYEKRRKKHSRLTYQTKSLPLQCEFGRVALPWVRSNGPTDPLHISCICSIWKILHFYSSFYTRSLKGEGGILFYLCPSVRPSFRPSKIFFVTFFSVTVDGRNLIFGHKHHIGIPYCG